MRAVAVAVVVAGDDAASDVAAVVAAAAIGNCSRNQISSNWTNFFE